MTDYVANTGTGGQLIIRDLGSTVQAIIKCTNGSTFVNGASWSITVGGGSASGSFNISGAQEVVVWSGTVSSNLHIQFNMGSTGTSGLGGPASVAADINRATVPAAPTPLEATTQGMTSVLYRFSGNSNGGAAIDQWQIGYGTNPSTPTTFLTSTGTSTITGLVPGTTYYFWSRGHNAVGWGAYSARSTATTYAGSRVKVSGIWKKAVVWVKVAGVWKRAQPWAKVSGIWKKTS